MQSPFPSSIWRVTAAINRCGGKDYRHRCQSRVRNGNCRIARMSVAVSVVVPTCGRPEFLRRCVAALEEQTLAADAFEIIVVDDTASRRGPAAARNIGWRRAQAPGVAFTAAGN